MVLVIFATQVKKRKAQSVKRKLKFVLFLASCGQTTALFCCLCYSTCLVELVTVRWFIGLLVTVSASYTAQACNRTTNNHHRLATHWMVKLYAGWFPSQFPPAPPVAPPNFAQSQMPASQVSLDGLGLVHTGYTKTKDAISTLSQLGILVKAYHACNYPPTFHDRVAALYFYACQLYLPLPFLYLYIFLII